MINTKLQNIIDTKSAIGNAINNKGGSITSETPFYEYAPAIENISTGGGAYSTFVAQAQNNSKYTVYTGYHQIDNPTPNLSNNFAFNRWILNNSATGDVVLSNVLTSQVATVPFLNNGVGINEAYIPFVNKTNVYGGSIQKIITNNGFIYALGGVNRIKKWNESTLGFVGNTSINSTSSKMELKNGFIYAAESTNRTIQKFNESTLTLAANSINTGSSVTQMTIDNNGDFLYVLAAPFTFAKYNTSTLSLVANSPALGGSITNMAYNNGFVYVATSSVLQKFYEGNLVRVDNAPSYNGAIRAVSFSNGFIYVGGATPQTVQKFHEGNLAFVGNTADYGGTIWSLTTNNGFVYAGGDPQSGVNRGASKFYESNLALVGNTANYVLQVNLGQIFSLTTNNGFIYAGGSNDQTVQKFVEQSNNLVETPVFEITTIKE
jgi:hypothetical protein